MQRYSSVATEEQNELPSWDSLRKQARHLEYQIDSRLITFSQSTTSSTPNTSTQQELSTLLQNLTKVTQDMGVWVQQNPSYSHLHSRHLSNLYEYNREFAKTRANIKSAQEHLELLSGSTFTGPGQNEYARMETSHEMVDEILQ
ncbi:hypothetical protein HDV06_006621 [Boothiomyces sp. JEL0866]|nr:hypothetical protein HDV06_006621 [Boothiomyces sp. JEL0866]